MLHCHNTGRDVGDYLDKGEDLPCAEYANCREHGLMCPAYIDVMTNYKKEED